MSAAALVVLLGVGVATQEAPDVLSRIRTAYDDVHCEVVQAETGRLLAEGVANKEETQEALFRAAACHVVNGDLSEASRYFARIMRDDLAAKPTFPVEPRVSVLIEAARSDEEKRQKQERLDERQKIIDSLKFRVDEPAPTVGGTRATFMVHLDTDPHSAVRGMRLSFHKESEADVYSLPLHRTGDGAWRGEIPGTYTRTPDAVALLWFVSLTDEHGETLTTYGSQAEPKTLLIEAGTVLSDLKAAERFPRVSRLAFASVGAVGVSAVFLVAGTGLAQIATGDQINDPNGRLGFAGMQLGLGSVGMLTATFSLLDGWQQFVPTLVTAGVGTAAYVGLLAVDQTQRPVYVDNGQLTNTTALIPLAGALVAGAGTATALVIFDAAE